MVGDDIVTELYLVQQSKNFIVLSSSPWEVGAVSKYKRVTYFTGICRSRVFDDSL